MLVTANSLKPPTVVLGTQGCVGASPLNLAHLALAQDVNARELTASSNGRVDPVGFNSVDDLLPARMRTAPNTGPKHRPVVAITRAPTWSAEGGWQLNLVNLRARSPYTVGIPGRGGDLRDTFSGRIHEIYEVGLSRTAVPCAGSEPAPRSILSDHYRQLPEITARLVDSGNNPPPDGMPGCYASHEALVSLAQLTQLVALQGVVHDLRERQHDWVDGGRSTSIPRGTPTLPPGLADAVLYRADGPDWQEERIAPSNIYSLGRVVEAQISPNVTIYARIGHEGEPVLADAARTVYVVGDGADVRSNGSVRAMALPPDVPFLFLAPRGHRLAGSLHDILRSNGTHTVHYRRGRDSEEASAYQGMREPDRWTRTDAAPLVPDLQFAPLAVPPDGKPHPYDARSRAAVGDLAVLAAKYPHAVIAVVNGKTSLSKIYADLGAAHIVHGQLAVVSGRAYGKDTKAPVHHAGDNLPLPLRL
jgi:hypothetical protein